jgi:hypothetical protein
MCSNMYKTNQIILYTWTESDVLFHNPPNAHITSLQSSIIIAGD